MPASEWLVRVIHADTGEVVSNPTYSTYQFMHATAYLRAKNAQHCHIYGRPLSTRFVLVEDLDDDAVCAMDTAGLSPSVIVETSKANYQAFVTVAPHDMPVPLAAAVARILALDYGGDLGSAKAFQLGRLPGTTNRKEKYEKDGMYPWTRLVRAKPRPAIAGAALLERAERELRSRAFIPSTLGGCVFDAISIGDYLAGDMTPDVAHGIYVESLKDRVSARPEIAGNRSAIDYAVACKLRASGFTQRHVATVLMYGSAKAAERGAAYVIVTVQRAFGMN